MRNKLTHILLTLTTIAATIPTTAQELDWNSARKMLEDNIVNKETVDILLDPNTTILYCALEEADSLSENNVDMYWRMSGNPKTLDSIERTDLMSTLVCNTQNHQRGLVHISAEYWPVALFIFSSHNGTVWVSVSTHNMTWAVYHNGRLVYRKRYSSGAGIDKLLEHHK